MKRFPKELTTVTRVSKLLALIIFLVSLFVAFTLGMQYQEAKQQNRTIEATS